MRYRFLLLIFFLSSVALWSCRKSSGTNPTTPPSQGTPQTQPDTPVTFNYSGTMKQYHRWRDNTWAIHEDSSLINTNATVVIGTDSMTVTVDSLTIPVYKIPATQPGNYTVLPCCRPMKQVIITTGFDTLKAFYTVTDPTGGPYYFSQNFVGVK